MKTDELDDFIETLMQENGDEFSAEGSNTINFCRSDHPCCKDVTDEIRIQTVAFAVGGKRITGDLNRRLERIVRRNKV